MAQDSELPSPDDDGPSSDAQNALVADALTDVLLQMQRTLQKSYPEVKRYPCVCGKSIDAFVVPGVVSFCCRQAGMV
jgi:hypothetical protein